VDAVTVGVAIGLGAVTGLAAGLVPGLHVNTVCVVALATAGVAGPTLAVALTAMAMAHAFSSILPSTYLGAPGEETLLSALPAHRMLLQGRGPDAVRAGLDGSLTGVVAGLAVLLPYKWLLGEPVRALAMLASNTAWILLAVLALLLFRERRRGVRGLAWASLIVALSGGLGLVSTRLNVDAFVPVAATPLLPLLSGLFGAPALLETLRARPVVPDQAPPAPVPRRLRRSMARSCLAGTLAAGATAVLPGVSSSVAAAMARVRAGGDDARPVLGMLGAIATSHLVLTFAVLWLSGNARTGLAVAVAGLWNVQAWTAGAAPLPLRLLLLAGVAAALLGYLLTAAVAAPAARLMPRLPPRPVALAALAVMVSLVVLFSGAWGMLVFAAAIPVGLLPLAAGLGRVHLTGCLLVPVIVYRLGWL
jgi:putative membrane protein